MTTVARWDTGEEEGLTPSSLVALGCRLREGVVIELRASEEGFVAEADGSRWDPYGLLSELLEDLGNVRVPNEGARVSAILSDHDE